jgi:uroporphyrinogen-III synthase
MRSLSGRTVLVTRSAEDAPVWAEELSGHGARTVVFPCIARQPIRDPGTAAALAAGLENADWLVLTSVHGAHGVAELVGARRGAGARVAVVGEVTELAAREVFGRVDLVAPNGTVRSLGEGLAQRIRDALGADSTRVVAAGAENARLDLEEALEPLGVEVRRIPVYRTVPASVQEPREDLGALGVDTIFLASPSAVAGLLARAVVPDDARIITIGPSTSEAVRDAGLRVDGEAAARSLEGLIEAMP